MGYCFYSSFHNISGAWGNFCCPAWRMLGLLKLIKGTTINTNGILTVPVLFYFGITMALLLTGCAAEMVNFRNPSSQYAPLNETRGGTIKYQLNDVSENITMMREDAYKQMYQACEGPYKIVREYEGNRETVGSVIPVGSIALVNSGRIPYQFIEFECEDSQKSLWDLGGDAK
jgi:hypothetical protein